MSDEAEALGAWVEEASRAPGELRVGDRVCVPSRIESTDFYGSVEMLHSSMNLVLVLWDARHYEDAHTTWAHTLALTRVPK
jgi:hypothetical protein